MTSFLSRLRLQTIRASFAWVVLFAYLFTAIMPLGFMPDVRASARGLFNITICTAAGLGHTVVDQTGQPGDHPAPGKIKTDACPYAGAPQVAGFTFLPVLLALFIFLERAAPAIPARASFQHFFTPAQPRAPPQI